MSSAGPDSSIEPLFDRRNIDLYIGTTTEKGKQPVQEALIGITLLNKAEFMKWMQPDVVEQSPRIKKKNKNKPKYAEGHADETDKVNEINTGILQGLASEVCSNINEDYGMAAMDLIINDIDEVDILVAVKDFDEPIIGATETVANNKIKKIVGFIIVEHGECESKPNLFCVNLICVKPGSRFNGKILMGAYLFCIKNSGVSEKYGILELANGYANIGGFISYMKMGFKPDLTLSNPDCFEDYNNLPMTHDTRSMSQQEIVKYATNVEEIEPVDDSGTFQIYEHFKTLSKEQKEFLNPKLTRFLLLNNVLYKSQIEGGFEHLKDAGYKYELKDNERELFDKMILVNSAARETAKDSGYSSKLSLEKFQEKIGEERTKILMEILETPGGKTTVTTAKTPEGGGGGGGGKRGGSKKRKRQSKKRKRQSKKRKRQSKTKKHRR